jgi:hypothetical protein
VICGDLSARLPQADVVGRSPPSLRPLSAAGPTSTSDMDEDSASQSARPPLNPYANARAHFSAAVGRPVLSAARPAALLSKSRNLVIFSPEETSTFC